VIRTVRLAVAVLSTVTGCQSKSVTEQHAAASASASASATVAPDTAAKGELAEGKEVAFGLRLPRGVYVSARMEDAVFAKGRLGFEATANYMRKRVLAKRVDTGPAKTVFLEAAIKSKPDRVVRVEVLKRYNGVEIIVRDKTRKPADKGLSEKERWKRAGLTPDGKVIKEQAE
jgi:hypothetical protein